MSKIRLAGSASGTTLNICLSIKKLICLVSAISIEHIQFQQADYRKIVSSEIGGLETSTSWACNI